MSALLVPQKRRKAPVWCSWWRASWSTVAVVACGGAVLVSGLGCGGSGQTQKPPEILYGKDTCRDCVMIVSDARYAAGYTDKDGMPGAFDDIGCMLQYLRDKVDFKYVLWVVDYETGEWIRTEDAWFVQGDEIITPMGSGIVALSHEESARGVAERFSGNVLRFAELSADGR